MYKIFNKLNMINKAYLHPIRTSGQCVIMSCIDLLSAFQQN